jgi:hypothetical protein
MLPQQALYKSDSAKMKGTEEGAGFQFFTFLLLPTGLSCLALSLFPFFDCIVKGEVDGNPLMA